MSDFVFDIHARLTLKCWKSQIVIYHIRVIFLYNMHLLVSKASRFRAHHFVVIELFSLNSRLPVVGLSLNSSLANLLQLLIWD